ncbi:MAG TPA: hypothetical protein VJK05_02785 [archaeon]|nr:hypothetical protein [archaeon]
MKRTLTNWRIALLLFLVIFSLGIIFIKGISFGIDFNGGTLFEIQLAESVKDPQKVDQIQSTIEQRLDATGLTDKKVNAIGSEASGYEFIQAQIAITDPAEVQRIESIILTQGKFEVMVDGSLALQGEEILSVVKDPSKGYGFYDQGEFLQWVLPFTLTEEGARNFSKTIFHKCKRIGITNTGNDFDCTKAYFFIDRPVNSIIVLSQGLFEEDALLLQQGNLNLNFSAGTSVNELLLNSNVPFLAFSESLTEEDMNKLNALALENRYAVIPESLNKEIKDELTSIGFELREFPEIQGEPWLWRALGARSIISLSESITNDSPYVENFEQAVIQSSLVIQGSASTPAEAKKNLDDLVILLESGSLPVGVIDVSKTIISPSFGAESLNVSMLIGAIALIVVALVLFIRYRITKIVVPIILTGFSEVVLVLGFASIINYNLDLAAIAGILAAVGTGVDDQIIITDELLKGRKEAAGNLLAKIAAAFFIIIATASTTIATMAPILLFGLGLGKLVGFAIMTISGVLIGILITRPAYAEIMKIILKEKI